MSGSGNRVLHVLPLLALAATACLPAFGQQVPDGAVVFSQPGSDTGNGLRQTTVPGSLDPYTQQTVPADLLSSGTPSDGYNTLSEDPVYRNSFQQSPDDAPIVVESNLRQEGNRRIWAAEQVGIIGPDGTVTTRVNSPVLAIEGVRRNPDIDPYAPVGFRLGTFTILPELTQSFGTTTNADFFAFGRSSDFSLTDFNSQAVSDWSIHELRGNIGGSY